VPDNGPQGPKNVEFIVIIKRLLCLKVIYMSKSLVTWVRISSLIYVTCFEPENKGTQTGRNVGNYKPAWRGVSEDLNLQQQQPQNKTTQQTQRRG
jgi:hypothetical protein